MNTTNMTNNTIKFLQDAPFGAFRFSSHVLNSQRISSYFFDTGAFNTGKSLRALAYKYANLIISYDIEFDMLFAPAYKGIPLVAAISISLYNTHGINVPYSFNRKESKPHGEQGDIIGAPLSGRVLIIDDVFTSGQSLKQSIKIVKSYGATPVAAVVAFDRQEMEGPTFASTNFVIKHQIPVYSIIAYNDIAAFIEGQLDVT